MAKKNLAALEVKVMAVLGNNNAEIEEMKEISSIRIPMCDGAGFIPVSKQLFRHSLYGIDRSYSGYAYKSLFKNEERKVVKSNNEENNMYYDAKEMAVKTLVEDFIGGKDLSILDRDFIAFNDCLVWAKICNKYPRVTNKLDIKKTDPKCFEKRMKRAEMIDQLSLRLSVLSKLGYINVDTFLNQYKNFFDACRAAKDLERLAYVNHKLSLDKNINEEYQNKFWQEYYKKMLEYANAYNKNEVVWGIPNTQEIKTEAMKRIIQTLTETNEKLSGRDFDYNDLQMIEVE